MTDWTRTTVVRVDREYDRERASNGNSRYGTYITEYNRKRFADWDDMSEPLTTAQFAVAAWEVATPPIMAPGFAQRRPDLLSVTARLTEDRHELFFDIAVPVYQGSMPGYRWRSWETQYGEGDYRYHHEPDGDRPALLTTTVVRIPAADWALPDPVAADSPDLVATAIDYVEAIVRQLNEAAGAVVADLTGR
ncbi:hypothetical protein ACFWIQ_36315 [Kitasatospora sp. NPDC127059]|uniref:hypothetical protein n=1 Tax=Kitasatospora sp. NPDC127059 TaxID=3347120 RepID=UPI00366A3D75